MASFLDHRDPPADAAILEWLSAAKNPPVRYLTARDLWSPPPTANELSALRAEIIDWGPLRTLLSRQLADGSFPASQKTPTAQPTLTALSLLTRCGLTVDDEPVARIVDSLTTTHMKAGAVSYTTGGSGVLPCYVGVAVAALIGLGAIETPLVQSSIDWLVDHQRFDHGADRAGGEVVWPYRAPANYGCWESVSCYHGVAGAFRGLAAIPAERRSATVRRRLDEAIAYLRVHDLYKKSATKRPMFRHMTQSFLVGDYRSDLLDMLQGVADADPTLISETWVADAMRDMDALTDAGRVVLDKNYGRKLIDPIPFEPVGAPSRFLTYQWITVRQTFRAVDDSDEWSLGPAPGAPIPPS